MGPSTPRAAAWLTLLLVPACQLPQAPMEPAPRALTPLERAFLEADFELTADRDALHPLLGERLATRAEDGTRLPLAEPGDRFADDDPGAGGLAERRLEYAGSAGPFHFVYYSQAIAFVGPVRILLLARIEDGRLVDSSLMQLASLRLLPSLRELREQLCRSVTGEELPPDANRGGVALAAGPYPSPAGEVPPPRRLGSTLARDFARAEFQTFQQRSELPPEVLELLGTGGLDDPRHAIADRWEDANQGCMWDPARPDRRLMYAGSNGALCFVALEQGLGYIGPLPVLHVGRVEGGQVIEHGVRPSGDNLAALQAAVMADLTAAGPATPEAELRRAFVAGHWSRSARAGGDALFRAWIAAQRQPDPPVPPAAPLPTTRVLSAGSAGELHFALFELTSGAGRPLWRSLLVARTEAGVVREWAHWHLWPEEPGSVPGLQRFLAERPERTGILREAPSTPRPPRMGCWHRES